jgi:hypothetical protein
VAHPYHSAIPSRGYHLDVGSIIRPDIGIFTRSCVSIDEQHVALPKLYGAPAYARPTAPVASTMRPFDPDDLPIEAVMTDEERELAASLPARTWAPGGAVMGDSTNRRGSTGRDANGEPKLKARALSLRSIAGRLLGGD